MPAYNAIKPDASPYGIFPTAYAQTLVQTPRTAGNILSQVALRQGAMGNADTYAQLIREAQAAQLAGQAATDASETGRTYLSNLAPMANAGVASAVTPPIPGVDRSHLQLKDTGELNTDRAGIFKTNSEGIENLAGVGYLPSAEDVGQIMTGSEDAVPLVVNPYLTPAAKTNQQEADVKSAMIPIESKRADAAYIRANKPASAGSSVGTQYIVTDGGFGMPPQVQVKTRDPAVAAEAAGGNKAKGPAIPAFAAPWVQQGAKITGPATAQGVPIQWKGRAGILTPAGKFMPQ